MERSRLGRREEASPFTTTTEEPTELVPNNSSMVTMDYDMDHDSYENKPSKPQQKNSDFSLQSEGYILYPCADLPCKKLNATMLLLQKAVSVSQCLHYLHVLFLNAVVGPGGPSHVPHESKLSHGSHSVTRQPFTTFIESGKRAS